jgi:polysaccharide biosynthesis/export protein
LNGSLLHDQPVTAHDQSRTIRLARLRAPEGEKMLNRMNERICRAGFAALALALWVGAGLVSGQNAPPVAPPTASEAAANPESLLLKEGDVIHIAFPGAPTLDAIQTIRRDGKITLEMVGEVSAAGLTPHALEEELLKKFGDQLAVKQVSVSVQSSTFIVYVTGSVLKPGKLVSERHLSPLQAVIEAGIDHTRANLKAVAVIRDSQGGKRERFTLNLAQQLKGRPTEPFALQPFDIIFVPEKFSWY